MHVFMEYKQKLSQNRSQKLPSSGPLNIVEVIVVKLK